MLARTKDWIRGFHADDAGAMSVEKIMLLAVIALPIVIILIAFGDKIVGIFKEQEGDVKKVGGD